MSGPKKLSKNLKLFDVYAMATGAMFSSGFFLLPGIAASTTGSSAYLAYFVAGWLIIPPMLCMAELSSAMPKAGGTYYFLDRSLGPLAGTIGGLGSWVAVVLKSAFALVGMGAYLSLYIDIPVTILAVLLTLVFGAVNVVGAKETTLLQRVLVTTLVTILAAFVIKGLSVIDLPDALYPKSSTEDFFKSGLIGFVATIGLVFVSYAGLTKVASVSEEVENPNRNIPLGMALSLMTATVVYTLGMLVMIHVLPSEELYASLTPVADAGRQFLGGVPYDLGVILIVVSAIAAFASTGNAGIMSASRYPFAMAKDNLVPEQFARLGRHGTPTLSIAVTVGVMVLILVTLDVESLAKLASAFQLLLFGLVCLAVIVMRESQIETYIPGYKAPFYPWLPISGIFIAFWLIVEMGILPIGFTGMMVMGCALWYFFYAFDKVDRAGAIYHVHARLGTKRYHDLEEELFEIVDERTRDENLAYENLISRFVLFDLTQGEYDFEDLLDMASEAVSKNTDIEKERLSDAFMNTSPTSHKLSDSVVLCYGGLGEIKDPQLIIFRMYENAKAVMKSEVKPHTVMFMFCPSRPPALDIRLAGYLSNAVLSQKFAISWISAKTQEEIHGLLMRDDHNMTVRVSDVPFLENHIGDYIDDIELPDTCFIALVKRGAHKISPKTHDKLSKDDTVVIVGEPDDLKKLRQTG